MTAEELLLSINAQSVESNEKCAIDPESREINIPPTYQIFGVESDEKVERIEFECPKIVGDNIDLSKLQIRINYRNANRDQDQYIVEDVETNGDNIEFSWLLSRKVTAYRGTVQFIVCAVNVSGAIIVNEWNTTLAEAEVLEGIEIGDPIVTESDYEVIEQLLQIVDNASDAAVAEIEQAEQEAVQRLQTLPVVENHIISFGVSTTGTLQTAAAEPMPLDSSEQEIDVVSQILIDANQSIDNSKNQVTTAISNAGNTTVQIPVVEDHIITMNEGE